MTSTFFFSLVSLNPNQGSNYWFQFQPGLCRSDFGSFAIKFKFWTWKKAINSYEKIGKKQEKPRKAITHHLGYFLLDKIFIRAILVCSKIHKYIAKEYQCQSPFRLLFSSLSWCGSLGLVRYTSISAVLIEPRLSLSWSTTSIPDRWRK